jgi:Fe2+ or Zn2+ uptake regulation protein
MQGHSSNNMKVLTPVFEYATRKVEENQERFKLNGTHWFLVCADCVNSLDKNLPTASKIIEALSATRKEVDLELHGRAGQNSDVRRD